MGANSTTTSSGRRARLIKSDRPTTHPQRCEPQAKEATVAMEPVEAQGGSVVEEEIVEEALERAAMPVDRVD